MPIPDNEIKRLCEEAFGQPLDQETRSSIAALLDTTQKGNLRLLDTLGPASEPSGHTVILKRFSRENTK